MRRKQTCTDATPTGERAPLLIAQLGLAELVVQGGADGLGHGLAAAGGPLRYEPRVRAGAWAGAAGSDVVVLDAVADGAAQEIAARCAGAVVVVATPAPVSDVED